MLPQHGGVPNFTLRLSGPTLAALILVLVTGTMITLLLHSHSSPGDLATEGRATFALVVTLLLTALIFIAGTGRWWHSHLWKSRGNSQQHHRKRTKKHRSHHSRRHP